ncbi:MAG: GntR family transcriptional regulator [Chloroflexi bacterium]|nr:GntR family transcriptional regulator [Chloroflexota bacterium]
MATAHAELISSAASATIDRNSPIPYYVQVKEALRERIERGDWKAGHQLPGELELCRIFEVSRTVIRQALKELTYEGLIAPQKGKGTFVAEPKIAESLVQKLTGFYQDMVDRGHNPVSQVLKQRVYPANLKVAARLAIQPGTPVIEIDRLRFIQDEPIVLVTTYLPYALCPQLLQADLSRQSLYAFLERECGLVIARGHRTIEAVPANEYEARLLQIEKGAPLILLDSVSYLNDGTPIEYYHALHRGDRSQFEVELVRIRAQGRVREALGGDATELPRSN